MAAPSLPESMGGQLSQRLYYDDPFRVDFSARVMERLTLGQRPAVVLDQTCFYPESGGQPGDRGDLNGVAVLDTQEREQDGAVLHVLAAPLDSDGVRGRVDWSRRLDHMQQHTGQHILSQACQSLLGADTVGFHLSDETVTIDLTVEGLSAGQATLVENAANQIIYEDRPVVCRFVAKEEMDRLPLRKAPKVAGEVRIVEVRGYDWSPCGGTHVRAAGQVGIIALRKWERKGAVVRLEFLCGQRALADYRWKNAAVNRLAAGLSIKDRELPETVERLAAGASESRRLLNLANEKLLGFEAAELAGAAFASPGVVVRVWSDRSAEEVRRLARRTVERPGLVALLGVAAGDKAHLIFACSADQSADMNALLKAVSPLIGGRGGGTPSLAQGGGPLVDALPAALKAAQEALWSTAPAASGEGASAHPSGKGV
jgi:alanyl-tRNA synthetase